MLDVIINIQFHQRGHFLFPDSMSILCSSPLWHLFFMGSSCRCSRFTWSLSSWHKLSSPRTAIISLVISSSFFLWFFHIFLLPTIGAQVVALFQQSLIINLTWFKNCSSLRSFLPLCHSDSLIYKLDCGLSGSDLVLCHHVSPCVHTVQV